MDRIRVALGGSEGRMGKVLQRLISETDDIEVLCRIGHGSPEYNEVDDVIGKPILSSVDVYGDFTNPDSVVGNIKKISEAGIDSVIGTTGWYDRTDEVRDIALKYGRRILYAPNFSIGVNVLFHLVDEASRLLGRLGYDVFVGELHHTDKVDSPSGTAKKLGTILQKNIEGKSTLIYERRTKRADNEIDVLGGRVGRVAGHHEVWFTPEDAYSEVLVLRHDAFSREVFGKGALEGIRWVYRNKGKKPGLHPFQKDVLNL